MTDNHLHQLLVSEPDRSLDHLEADIWRGEARQMAAWRRQKFIASCQTAVLSVAIIVSVGAGILTGGRNGPAYSTPTLLTDGVDIAPSNLLFGNRQ